MMMVVMMIHTLPGHVLDFRTCIRQTQIGSIHAFSALYFTNLVVFEPF